MIVPSFEATVDITTLPVPAVAGLAEGCETSSSKKPTQAYVLFALAYVRAVSSTPLIVYAALVTSAPLLMLVNAGATKTIKSAMMPTTMSSSTSVNALSAEGRFTFWYNCLQRRRDQNSVAGSWRPKRPDVKARIPQGRGWFIPRT